MSNDTMKTDAGIDTLEQRASEKRADISQTLSAIEDQFSPSQMVDNAMAAFKDNGGDIAQSLGDSFRNNPMPYVLTGVGLAWMMASQQRSNGSHSGGRYASAGHNAGADTYARHHQTGGYNGMDRGPSHRYGNTDSGDHESGTEGLLSQAKDAADEIGDRVKEAGDQTMDVYQGMKDSAGDTAQHWRNQAEEHARQARHASDRLSSDATAFFREQPFVVGALGLAVGALIGAVLPSTKVESKAMGEIAADARQNVQQTAHEGVEKISDELESASSTLANKASSELNDLGSSGKKAGDVHTPATANHADKPGTTEA